MNIGSKKTSEYLETIYKRKSEHTHIEWIITYNSVYIIRATREVSKNLTIWTVSYRVLKKSLVAPDKELKKYEEDIMRVKRKKDSSTTITLKYRKTLINPS